MKFKLISKGKNVEFQAFGKNIDESFKNSALALTNIICKQPVRPIREKKIQIYGKDLKKLLYNFLEKILVLIYIDGFLISEVRSLKILGTGINLRKRKYELEVKLYGDDVSNYKKDMDFKSIVHNSLSINQERLKGKTMFVCQVVVGV